MAFHSCVSTGWDSLDQIIDQLRRGDNVVWQVDNIDDYQRLVTGGWYTTLVCDCKNSTMKPSVHRPFTYSRFSRV